jgi:hypothetical protein
MGVPRYASSSAALQESKCTNCTLDPNARGARCVRAGVQCGISQSRCVWVFPNVGCLGCRGVEERRDGQADSPGRLQRRFAGDDASWPAVSLSRSSPIGHAKREGRRTLAPGYRDRTHQAQRICIEEIQYRRQIVFLMKRRTWWSHTS